MSCAQTYQEHSLGFQSYPIHVHALYTVRFYFRIFFSLIYTTVILFMAYD